MLNHTSTGYSTPVHKSLGLRIKPALCIHRGKIYLTQERCIVCVLVDWFTTFTLKCTYVCMMYLLKSDQSYMMDPTVLFQDYMLSFIKLHCG